ncbi:MAG: EamA family transporter, partial [Desulfovibrionales bacterium]|nr:EamA family transporter [Desulfovibrionales bacterium]
MRTFSGTLAFAALLLAMLLWGSSFVAFKYAVQTYDPFVIIFARMVLATLMFALSFRIWKPTRI